MLMKAYCTQRSATVVDSASTASEGARGEVP